MRNLSRLFQARSIAVVGGGAWCASIIGAARRIGYQGDLFPVHPSGKEIAGLPSLTSLSDYDGPIDGAFIGVNRHASLQIVRDLNALNAGGAICFASGFSEATAEDASGADLQAELVSNAGDMPVLGPNCYGFINALDQVAIWPDQHGMVPIDRGVAILTQSSNIAINLTMQQRGLPIAYMVTCGNMAQTSQAQIALDLLDDMRVTAIGLHIEGFGDTRLWHQVALKAAKQNIPLVAIKVGVSEHAQQAAISHTASIAGSDAGADALLKRLGIGRVYDLPSFLETLKLFHVVGRLDAPTLSSISCSGGEASLIADMASTGNMEFPELTTPQKSSLAAALGPMVALANPLDYHTYIWRDTETMTDAWAPMAAQHIGITSIIVDYPHTDAGDWVCATDAALAVRARSDRPVAVVATLPELMPSDVAEQLMQGGVVPMYGLREAVTAFEIASILPDIAIEPPIPGGELDAHTVLTEADAKFALSSKNMDLPRRVEARRGELQETASGLMPPLALKGLGLAHKSEMGAVKLNLTAEQLEDAADAMPVDQFLIEEMVNDGVAELLVGVTRDAAHGLMLTIGAGGVMTEIWQDTVSLLLPVRAADIEHALDQLKVSKMLDGFRGKPAANRPAIVAAVMAVQAYVVDHYDELGEVEINPLICTPTRAIAVDALIRKV
ncbi:MAG: acetate--CoA ligase family protein [Aliishimia sp.]